LPSDLAELGLWTKQLIAGLLLVPSGPLIAIVLGLALARRRPRLALSLIVLGTFVLVALSLPIVAAQIAAPVERAYPPFDERTPVPAHAAIVVLGGGLTHGALDYGGETVNATTLTRLRRAARLATATRLPVLVAGGRPRDAVSAEGDLMADALTRDFHVPVRWIERESLDTDDNARYAAVMLKAAGIDTALLVTEVQHMHRAQPMFEARGLHVIPVPTDYYAGQRIGLFSFIPSTLALRRSSIAIHEHVGALWARLRA